MLFLNMFKKTLTLIAVFISLCLSSIGQSLVNVTSVQGFPDVLVIGQSYNLVVGLSYVSGGQPVFSEDNLRIKYLTDKMIEDGLDAAHMGAPLDVNIALGETLEVEIWDFDVLEEQFRVGGNIVVIWPSYNGNPPSDTLLLELQATDSQGVMGLQKVLPEMQKFWVNSEIEKKEFDALAIQNAWISDAMGKVICTIAPNRQWDNNLWPAGIYYLSITDRQGRFFTYKAFKLH
jgi:hypothetical protein